VSAGVGVVGGGGGGVWWVRGGWRGGEKGGGGGEGVQTGTKHTKRSNWKELEFGSISFPQVYRDNFLCNAPTYSAAT